MCLHGDLHAFCFQKELEDSSGKLKVRKGAKLTGISPSGLLLLIIYSARLLQWNPDTITDLDIDRNYWVDSCVPDTAV